MTTYNKTTLKTFFEQGDIPTGTNYADLIDSNVNLVETAIQTMAGPLSTTELITPRVSASNAVFGGANFAINVTDGLNVSADSCTFDVLGTVNFDVGNFTVFTSGATGILLEDAFGSSLTIDNADAQLLAIDQLIIQGSAVEIYSTADIQLQAPLRYTAPVIISAAGTAQTTAALLTSTINRGKGVVDGTTTGFRPPANRAGLVQYLYNEGASANLWPPTGGTINGLAANAVFPLAASAAYTILHLTASAYAVHG